MAIAARSSPRKRFAAQAFGADFVLEVPGTRRLDRIDGRVDPPANQKIAGRRDATASALATRSHHRS